MSRTTPTRSRRSTAALTAALVATATVGAGLAGTSSALAPATTVDAATVANPVADRRVPTIPAAGPFDGSGTAVRIVGTNFPATPTVTFDATPATSVMRLSDSLIVAKAPASTATTTTVDDAVDITVADQNGSGVTATDLYTYKAGPTLTSAAYSADFRKLELTGTNLADTRTLQLGPVTVKVRSTEATATGVSVRVPSALTRATYAVTVNTDWGSDTLAPDWNVRPAPVGVYQLDSTRGVRGGDSLSEDVHVRILGKSLGGVDSVTFGGTPAPFLVSSDTELFVKVPPMVPGTPLRSYQARVDVVVKNGALAAGRRITWTYGVKPIVTAVDATSAATGTAVTVTGENLLGARLYFGAERGALSLTPRRGSTATSAQYVMPTRTTRTFAFDTAYPLWFVTRGGNLQTGRTLTVTNG